MTFPIVALIVWIFVLALVFSLAMYAARQFEQPVRKWVIVALCIVAIFVLLGFVTGQVPLLGFEHARKG